MPGGGGPNRHAQLERDMETVRERSIHERIVGDQRATGMDFLKPLLWTAMVVLVVFTQVERGSRVNAMIYAGMGAAMLSALYVIMAGDRLPGWIVLVLRALVAMVIAAIIVGYLAFKTHRGGAGGRPSVSEASR